MPDITMQEIITISYNDVQDELQFPLVWTTACFLSSLWNLRIQKQRVELIKIRADMEASVRILRESRLDNTVEILQQIF